MSKILGDKELMRKLQGLEKKVAKKAINKAMSKAVRPVIREARSIMRPVSPTIAKSYGVKRKRYQGGSIQVAIIGARVGDNVASTKTTTNPITGKERAKKHLPWFTAHLVELGTKPHQIHLPWLNLTLQHPGTKAHPALAPALERKQFEVIETHAEVIRVEVERYGRT